MDLSVGQCFRLVGGYRIPLSRATVCRATVFNARYHHPSVRCHQTTPGEVRFITGVRLIPPPWADTPSKQFQKKYHPGSTQKLSGSFRHRTSCTATLNRNIELPHGRPIAVDRTPLWPRRGLPPDAVPYDKICIMTMGTSLFPSK